MIEPEFSLYAENKDIIDYISWKVFEKKLITNKFTVFRDGSILPVYMSYNKGFIYIKSYIYNMKICVKRIRKCSRCDVRFAIDTYEYGTITLRIKNETTARAFFNIFKGIMDGRLKSEC